MTAWLVFPICQWNIHKSIRHAFEKKFRTNHLIIPYECIKLPNIEEYNKDKEELLKNLDEKAKTNCLKILDRIENFNKYNINNYCLKKKLFSTNDIKEHKKCKKYINNYKKVNNYYQLEHYKLPINNFEPSVFYYKHGIDTLKTFDKLDDKAIIDVGCFIADSCLVFRDYTKNKIYTFEPDIK